MRIHTLKQILSLGKVIVPIYNNYKHTECFNPNIVMSSTNYPIVCLMCCLNDQSFVFCPPAYIFFLMLNFGQLVKQRSGTEPMCLFIFIFIGTMNLARCNNIRFFSIQISIKNLVNQIQKRK